MRSENMDVKQKKATDTLIAFSSNNIYFLLLVIT